MRRIHVAAKTFEVGGETVPKGAVCFPWSKPYRDQCSHCHQPLNGGRMLEDWIFNKPDVQGVADGAIPVFTIEKKNLRQFIRGKKVSDIQYKRICKAFHWPA